MVISNYHHFLTIGVASVMYLCGLKKMATLMTTLLFQIEYLVYFCLIENVVVCLLELIHVIVFRSHSKFLPYFFFISNLEEMVFYLDHAKMEYSHYIILFRIAPARTTHLDFVDLQGCRTAKKGVSGAYIKFSLLTYFL